MAEHTIITARNISKSFGSNHVLNDLSFEVERGIVLGIEGENGSGKSTLLNILARYWKADSGSLVINGRIGFCPQSPMLFVHLTVEENLSFFKQAYGMGKNRVTDHRIARLDELLRTFNFPEPLSKKCSKLSGGTLQKLNLIIALMNDPDILLLDEPYASFDWETYLSFWKFSENLRNEGKTLIIISHIIYAREKLDRIWTLRRGKLV
ncbi:MAG: ABC transporter ATP-binding protein [Bacteroidales bacterium]|jgi:ABC-type multidrug transport system ATPase subunit